MLVGKYLRGLQKVYPNSTDYKFIYISKEVFNTIHKSVTCYFLLKDKDTGEYKIWAFAFRRKEAKTVDLWRDFIKTEGYEIFTTAVLPAFNAKNGTSFSFDSLLAWRITDEIQTGKTSLRGSRHTSKSQRRKS